MNWKCLLYGGCEYEVYKEDPYVDTRGNIIGTVFVLKCKKCGDLKAKIVINTNLYSRKYK